MGKRSPREAHAKNDELTNQHLRNKPDNAIGQHGARNADLPRVNDKDEAHIPQTNIIRLQYTNGDTYEGQINQVK